MPEPPAISEREQQLVTEFAGLSDWQERYRRIIEIGRELPAFPEDRRVDVVKVQGCLSQVWLIAAVDPDTGRMRYQADSDAHIVRGLIAVLLRVYNDQLPADVVAAAPAFLDELQLAENLSHNRANGLQAILKQIKLYAFALKALADQRAARA